MKDVQLDLPDAPTILPVQANDKKIYIYERGEFIGKLHRCPTGIWSALSLQDSESVEFATESLSQAIELGLRRRGRVTELDGLEDLYSFLAIKLR